ncbi:S8 family peptidase [Stigmatella sp. ncwal1]|uniref:S8 family peptidase n=1 Tax=Stigmatella ashevillensis TaxID=2995309 RepID=A0ABT5D8F9_9BACT|nr:S8 family peptidase [Stigmatella ashevillena]MDC0709949.1 S8 family peptidase [Stigmatella ashevillena]
MAEKRNFLLGYGERLQVEVSPPHGGGPKWKPYDFLKAKTRLSPLVARVAQELASMPEDAFPNDQAVVLLTLHPAFLAKSYFPGGLLREVNLQLVGSKPAVTKPEVLPKRATSKELVTSELYVAAPREVFLRWAEALPGWGGARGQAELERIENIRLPGLADKVRHFTNDLQGDILMEVVLHGNSATNPGVVDGFAKYLKALEMKFELGRKVQVGGLTYVALRAARKLVTNIAGYSFLRAVRPMPQLRHAWPKGKTSKAVQIPFQLPTGGPVDPLLKVAVFDGGLPAKSPLAPWAKDIKAPGVSGPLHPDLMTHGLGVSSAVLFGPLTAGAMASLPYAAVDHYGVFDQKALADQDVYGVLERIRTVLQQGPDYRFVNLSLGPETPVIDEVVDAWTATIDELLASGTVLATVASGNGGNGDVESGNARVQPPADCVNALTVGACDKAKKWARAPYSSFGPGRTPGIIKPDGVIFGGTDQDPFLVSSMNPGIASGITGTSFAAPYALRVALGMRATLGDVLQPLALKALMVHCAELGRRDVAEVGWGRFETDMEQILTSGPGEARVLFQGHLEPGGYMRLPIPIPAVGLQGKVELSATFCFATLTDPQDPLAYTRAGLDIHFRPNKDGRSAERPDAQEAETDGFFKKPKVYKTEQELLESHKWDTTRHAVRRFRQADLLDPVFDVHYNARAAGQATTTAGSLPYALVVTIRCVDLPNLYDLIVQRYRGQLQALTPITVQVPVRT